MLTRRQVLLSVSVLLFLAAAWSTWQAVQTVRDLRDARATVDRIREAVEDGNASSRDEAVSALQESARSARDRTDGFWWGVMTWAPFVGDDAGGVKNLSASLDLIATEAIDPLAKSVDALDGVSADGRVAVEQVSALQPGISSAHDAFASAAELVVADDSSGFAGPFKSRYDEYVILVSDLARDLGSVETAVEVLPTMLGADGPRRYLLIFENNAEIRATGGLPGSWALVEASNGKLNLSRQGSANDFDIYGAPIGNITPEEKALFGEEMGRFFQDPNFTPDFPRAAQVFDAFWQRSSPDTELDGVVSIDVVALSYLLDGLGPITSGGVTLTAGNVVEALLSDVYQEPDPAKQDEIFRGVARAIFDATTAGPADPLVFVTALSRAAREGRFHIASFEPEVAAALAGTRVAGELSADDGMVPHVDVALNDASASKMSYYLRYVTEIRSLSCVDAVQRLAATVTLSQTIAPNAAASLPRYVTGAGPTGGDVGDQLVRLHIFAPFGGSVSNIKIDGVAIVTPPPVYIKGRPAVTLAVLLNSLDDVVVTAEMRSAPGQVEDGVLDQTPSVAPGGSSELFPSSC